MPTEILVDPNALERTFTIPERNRAIVREFRRSHRKGLRGQGRYPRSADGKTLVFAVTKRHAETLAQMFDAGFAHRKPSAAVRYADFVVSEMGMDDTVGRDDQDQAIQERGVPQDSRLREHARYRLRLSGSREPRHGSIHQVRHPLPADARSGHAQGSQSKTRFSMFDFVGVTDFHGDEERMRVRVASSSRLSRARTRRSPGHFCCSTSTTTSTRRHASGLHSMKTETWISRKHREAKANTLGVRFEAWLLARRSSRPIRSAGSEWSAARSGRTLTLWLSSPLGTSRSIRSREGGHRVRRSGCSVATSGLTPCSSRSMERCFGPTRADGSLRATARPAALITRNQSNAHDPRDAPLDRTDPRLPVTAAAIPIRSATPSSSRSCSSSI